MTAGTTASGVKSASPRRRHGTIAWRLTLWFLLLSSIPLAVMVVFVRHNVTEAFMDLATIDGGHEAEALPDLVRERVLAIEREAALQLGLSLVVVAVAGGAVIWLTVEPIRRLTSAAEAIGEGRLDVQIACEDAEGEVARLTEAFNEMAGQLAHSYALLEQQVADRTRELDSLNRIALAVGKSVDPSTMLGDALDTVLAQLGFDAGAIGLMDEDAGELHLARCLGFDGELCAAAPWEGAARRVVLSGRPFVVDEPAAEPALAGSVARQGFGLVAIVPLRAGGRIEGVLVTARRHGALSDGEADLLVSIGHQIGVGVQNSRLHDQATQLAVLEERRRLARDLHDSVTQSLYAVTLYGEAAVRLFAGGDREQAEDNLRRACSTAQMALQEMRLLIYELRPSGLRDKGIVSALADRLEQVEGRTGVNATLQADENLPLAPPVEEALFHIAQEALNNALKHAHPRTVHVDLRRPESNGPVVLEVRDDGRGMDLATAGEHGGLGLTTMRERAEKLGGRFALTSAPGAGTTVRVEVMPQPRPPQPPPGVGRWRVTA